MVLKKVNEENQRAIQRVQKDIKSYEKEMGAFENRQNRIYEAYEEGVLINEQFLQRKREITIDRRREIESIHLKLTDELIQFLQTTEGTSDKGVPSKIFLRDLGIQVLDLRLAI